MLKRVDNNLLMKISKSDNKLCKKTSSKTIEEKKGFNILGPAELDANEKIYTDAINFALENKNIKNIAITGIYGAGKSSIWLTHIKKWNVEKKPIFISLGNYDVSVNPKSKTFEESTQENRVERQIINQILAQIDKDKIILSKYNFKKNISFWSAGLKAICYSLVVLSVFSWFYRADITAIFQLYFINWSIPDTSLVSIILFLVSLVTFFYYLNKEYRVKIDKVSFKGAEARFNESVDTDETILDRDIKEIVYLLYSAEVECVIFEDLDRYNNINIFTKLRELNFLLNSFILANKKEYTVKFVYMLRDGLFLSKNRTKFFDFILPVVPIVDSRTSEHILVDLFASINFPPSKDVLSKIALYIDDMRLLKNIVNEYKVYSEIIQPKDLDLDCNKLFAMITLKNIFPYEFDLLQINQGYIIDLFHKLEDSKEKIIDDLDNNCLKLRNEINMINDKLESNKFELMALMIPSNISFAGGESGALWSDLLKDWSKEKSQQKQIFDHYSNNSYNFEQFLEKYILTSVERKNKVDNLYEDKKLQIKLLEEKIEKINTKIKKIDIYSYAKILSTMNSEDRENIFTKTTNKIIDDHYFPLIRLLISEGLIDETYEYYKGKFNFDKSKLLGKNDVIFLKSLYENKQLDVSFKVNNPKEILSRLSNRDYSRFNILNTYIFQEMLNEGLVDKIIIIIKAYDKDRSYSNLAKILDDFDLSMIDKFIQSLITIDVGYLLAILNECKINYITAYQNILVALITNENIDNKYLDSFKELIEANSNILALVPANRVQTLIKHIDNLNLKFNDLTNIELSKEVLLIIEEHKAFRLNINNILLITERILAREIEYGSLITNILNLECLKSSSEYISANFDEFITDYIMSSPKDITYYNDENVVINVYSSKISNDLKITYLSNNKCIISDATALNITEFNQELFDIFLTTNTIKFNKENLAYYWTHITHYDEELVQYIESNIMVSNIEEILIANKSICNDLITYSGISIRLFDLLLQIVDKMITELEDGFTKERISKLIGRNLLAITVENVKYIISKKYYSELVLWLNFVEEIDKERIIKLLLDCELEDELIYDILNSNVSLNVVVPILDKLSGDPLLELIDIKRTELVIHILNNYLSEENKKFISIHFLEFKFKDEFIIALNQTGQLLSFINMCNDKVLILYFLNNNNISIDDKIEIIKNKISSINENELKEYMLAVDEVSELALIWDGKYPSVDTQYKEEIVELLVQLGTVKRRKDNKIMLQS
ncbi:hypothetical protein VEIT17_06650 [Veillonella nakazawae]|uniref:YobI-like P-loop NTPase domain-containing protein n=2 Tax=Veillonella nakazawae TaxID=2682456 RepID=A0ABM7HB37_9FIRM|nr:hypothetical protein [Veillonella nakazawae]BBU34219.1 hypothetical protein VEIT17_06650 [Veillonella nakazawae]